MGRNAQLIRQWAILKQIETNRWTTISDLADSHIVSTKTIRRDLAALMEAGFPLYDERYDGKVYWRLNEEYKGLTLANLSLSETAALYFSKKLVVNLAAPPFSSDIASAFKKIESALPERNIQFLDSLDSMISVRADAPKDLDEHKQVIRTLMEAIGEQHRVRMRYYSVHSQKRKEYLLDPYRLMYFRGGLYLFGYVAEYKQIRTFAIERIESIEKLHDRFEKPSDFSVETYLESSFGLVKEDPFDVEIIFGGRRCRVRAVPRVASLPAVPRTRRRAHPHEASCWWRVRTGFVDPEFRSVGTGRLSGTAARPCGARACASSGKLQEGNHGRSSEESSQSGSSQSETRKAAARH